MIPPDKLKMISPDKLQMLSPDKLKIVASHKVKMVVPDIFLTMFPKELDPGYNQEVGPNFANCEIFQIPRYSNRKS